ncbi:FkbM family methyltransferase [Pseudaestuariivita sp.]|uniref:FkbM family methyltransferase n=1 Tax=Pseudaestuariivita sp. TaxID=2211669 RepID=UPI004059D81D
MPEFAINGVVLDVPETLLDDKLTGKLAEGRYEEAEARAVKMRVQAGQRVLELGGGIGYISALCAQQTDPENVVTVEANPETLDVIRANLDRNGGAKTTLIHGAVALGAKEGATTKFHISRRFWASSLAGAEVKRRGIVRVPRLGLFRLFRQHRPHIVIVDIEGGEAELFDKPWPKHVRQVIMELHPAQYPTSTIKKIVDCMSASGLTYDPGCARGKLIAFRRVWSAQSVDSSE